MEASEKEGGIQTKQNKTKWLHMYCIASVTYAIAMHLIILLRSHVLNQLMVAVA